MKIYKSTRAKNAIEKAYNGLKYVSCSKQENGTYSVVFVEDMTGHYHEFICDFSGSMVLVIRHSIGSIKFVENAIISDTLETLNG